MGIVGMDETTKLAIQYKSNDKRVPEVPEVPGVPEVPCWKLPKKDSWNEPTHDGNQPRDLTAAPAKHSIEDGSEILAERPGLHLPNLKFDEICGKIWCVRQISMVFIYVFYVHDYTILAYRDRLKV